MAAYAWRGRNARGELVTGSTEADSDNALATQLLLGGVTPIEVKLVEVRSAGEAAAATSPLQALFSPKVSDEDILVLSRQLYTLQKAGVPLLRSLAGLEASSDKPALIELLTDLRASLDQGRELSAGMARHPKVF
jgi:MSHA biogenesis protein MshG